MNKLEKKWQVKWEKARIFEANVDPKREKFLTSLIIPYVNGNIHIGHSFTYTRTDVYARFKRMQGFNVCLAQGFHATGEPILGTVKRLKKGDKSQIDTFKIYGATEKDLKRFETGGAEEVAKFWTEKIIETENSIGFSIDWRRKFITAINPTFNRFIEWQYNTLRKKGYVIQGTHPVIWCPHDQSPTGDHDRLKGEGESPIEFVILKFKLSSGEILPCATLRPETIFGVTNLWINPKSEYVKAKINNETWIVSKEAVEKLKDQLKNIEVIGPVTTKITEVIHPLTKHKVPILPGEFVNSATATGLVMSVPSHAPYDYIALKELDKLKTIKPISVVKVEGSDNLAIDISEKMGIKNTKDIEKLEEATSQVYKKEYHTGVLGSACGKYAGKRVSEIKEVLIKDLIGQNVADRMWETINEVICRCTNKCHVKILENQWFLKFSDKKWKEEVKQCIANMKFYPEEARTQFLNTVDWLDDKACARKSGLGTKMPWDREWIVETLSDSVIYMAYYTIARVINENKIEAEKLTDEVFDYIFLNKGGSKEAGKKSGLSGKLVKEMKEEFEYFYPLDLRNSGKDLVQNHLTYALFHHVAIWDDPKYWPKAYGVNGFVTVEGEKMAKSKGNIIPLNDLINKHGADMVRINVATSNENIDDANWREDSLKAFNSKLTFLQQIAEEWGKADRKSENKLDKYMESVLQNCIKGATENYEVMKFRSGIQYSIFQLLNELQYYVQRCGGVKNCNKSILKESIITVVKLIAPFTPHLSEELWSELGGKGFVSVAEWPTFDQSKIDRASIDMENILKKTQEDLVQVIKLAGGKKVAYLYFLTDKELDYLKYAETYLKQMFSFDKIVMCKASDKNKHDPENRASRAKFGKPAIYLE